MHRPLNTTPEIPSQSRVHPGELWQLGEHRLMCGDCTQEKEVARLMLPGEQADLLFLDPPYGVHYQSKPRNPKKPGRTLLNDNLGEQRTRSLVTTALRVAPLRAGGVFYLCCPSGNSALLFLLALEDAGLTLRQTLIWVKHAFVLSRQDYHWRHETLLYGWKGGARHYFVNDRTQSTIWEFARPIQSRLHPTMKPLQLVVRALCNSSQSGEIVFDGFGGSGTTLLACEQTGRRCVGMEIEPTYCDIILERFENVTGKQVRRIANFDRDVLSVRG